ncbi:MAG: hypothetical protein AAF206_21255, partial [Bacteroidota bacterium]
VMRVIEVMNKFLKIVLVVIVFCGVAAGAAFLFCPEHESAHWLSPDLLSVGRQNVLACFPGK